MFEFDDVVARAIMNHGGKPPTPEEKRRISRLIKEILEAV